MPPRRAGPTGKVMLLPEDPTTCHIMVATGTGIAPFRSYIRRFFCEDVPNDNFKGLAWLFMGVANSDAKLYDDEFQALLARYPDQFRLDYALSREQNNRKGGKMYIQDKVEEYKDQVFDLMNNGAHMYFCGLKGMMPGILEMLEAVCKEKGLNFEEWLESAWRAAALRAHDRAAHAHPALLRRPEAQGAVARGDTCPRPAPRRALHPPASPHDSDATPSARTCTRHTARQLARAGRSHIAPSPSVGLSIGACVRYTVVVTESSCAGVGGNGGPNSQTAHYARVPQSHHITDARPAAACGASVGPAPTAHATDASAPGTTSALCPSAAPCSGRENVTRVPPTGDVADAHAFRPLPPPASALRVGRAYASAQYSANSTPPPGASCATTMSAPTIPPPAPGEWMPRPNHKPVAFSASVMATSPLRGTRKTATAMHRSASLHQRTGKGRLSTPS